MLLHLLHRSVLMFYGKIFRLSDWIMEVYAAGLLLVMVAVFYGLNKNITVWSVVECTRFHFLS